jgi:hypothetical protein
MVFPNNGVVEAPEITPSPYGLLSVAKPENSTDEDQWVRGFSQEWETELYSAKVWDDTDTTSHTIASNATPSRHLRVKPFFIEVEEVISTFGFTALDRMARISRQLEGVTQKAIEHELWIGTIRAAQTHDNKALTTASGVTILNSGTALSARRALALLEHRISDISHCGEQGVIHMTKDVASLLASNSQMLFHAEGKDHLQTFGGTPVVLGSGYSGSGPVGDAGAAASPTNKWMFATGTVRVYLGKVDVVNDGYNQAYNNTTNTNDMRLKAIRPAAVYFDSSIHIAVRVDLTA